jgi:hypothetical protein
MEKAQWIWWFMWFGPPERNTLHPQSECCCIDVCCSSLELTLPKRASLNPLPTQSFYSSRPGSYVETLGSTGGPKVVETLYNIHGLNG